MMIAAAVKKTKANDSAAMGDKNLIVLYSTGKLVKLKLCLLI